MDQNHNKSHSYINLIMNKSSSWLEVRLFYVRITPCVIESVPGHLTLRHLGRSISTPLEINGSKIPAADSASLNLRRDRLNKESSERGLKRHPRGNNGSVERLDNDAKTGWCLECCVATGVFEGKSVFKLGVSAPVIEVYIAGCCRGVPVILTKTVLVSPRKKASRYAILDAIPEDEELDK
ncbi:hypothetical protein OIU78_011448 [Salix suchowensis]|nr:hypothetical protein OIU78_011448 [Salix suchowensis]